MCHTERSLDEESQGQQRKPDRSPSSRALIIHPHFNDNNNDANDGGASRRRRRRHPIYYCLSEQHQEWRTIPISGFTLPFIVHQNFEESNENLGACVWRAGIVAAEYIRHYAINNLNLDPNCPETWGSVNCLELGCGTAALVGQCAALCGIKTVMTDLPQVLEWAKQNVRHNFTDQWKNHPHLEMSLQRSKPGSISPLLAAQSLCWGEPSDLPHELFDIVVAADCLYATYDEPELQDKLLYTLTNLLANKRTKLLVSYQLRTGYERTFIHEKLLTSLNNEYVVEEIRDCPSITGKVHSLAWVLPKKCATI